MNRKSGLKICILKSILDFTSLNQKCTFLRDKMSNLLQNISWKSSAKWPLDQLSMQPSIQVNTEFMSSQTAAKVHYGASLREKTVNDWEGMGETFFHTFSQMVILQSAMKEKCIQKWRKIWIHFRLIWDTSYFIVDTTYI